jgi:hypothetical protein
MGWISWNTKHDKLRFPTAGDYLANSYTRRNSEGAQQTVVAHKMVGGVWYAALRVEGQPVDDYTRAAYPNPADFTTALVVLTEGSWGGQWSEKGMDESVGPSESRCPASILAKLTPLNMHQSTEWARAWRERCRGGVRRAA